MVSTRNLGVSIFVSHKVDFTIQRTTRDKDIRIDILSF